MRKLYAITACLWGIAALIWASNGNAWVALICGIVATCQVYIASDDDDGAAA